MKDRKSLTHDTLKLFDYYIYHNLTGSLCLRKQGNIEFSEENESALLSWGISTFAGGEFSESGGEMLVSLLKQSDSPHWVYLPDNRWISFVKNAFCGKLKEKGLNLYKFSGTNISSPDKDSSCILPVTREFMEMNLPGTDLITNELYSYTDMDDFFKNGLGLALVIDGVVSGYCLSEYSVNNSYGINIWIDEKYRRLGYAKKMVNIFLSHSAENNSRVFWACNADNIPSNRLAVSSGFTLENSLTYFEI